MYQYITRATMTIGKSMMVLARMYLALDWVPSFCNALTPSSPCANIYMKNFQPPPPLLNFLEYPYPPSINDWFKISTIVTLKKAIDW